MNYSYIANFQGGNSHSQRLNLPYISDKIKMPNWNCSVMNCKNNTHGPLRFFSFPKDYERRQLWAESCGRSNWFPTDLSRICEVHFDKSQFEQDGKKLLKWSAIPRMYEEWTEHLTSPVEEHSHKSHEFNDDGACLDHDVKPEDDKTNVRDTAMLEVEGTCSTDWKEAENLKRKRLSSENEQDSEELSLQGGTKKLKTVDKTDDLEDELSRIKAEIKRFMEEDNTKQKSDILETSHKNGQERKSATNTSGTTTRHSDAKKSLTVSLSPLRTRRESERISKLKNISDMAHIKRHPVVQLQRTENVREIGSNTNQLPKRKILSNVTFEKTQVTPKQGLNVSTRQSTNLQHRTDNKKSAPQKKLSDKPWRTPDEIFKLVNNSAVDDVPEKRTKVVKRENYRKNLENMRRILSIQPKSGEMKRVDTPLRMVRSSSSLHATPETRSTLPRIVNVQTLNLLKDTEKVKTIPSRESQRRSSSKYVAAPNETPSRISGSENSSILKDALVKKPIVPRILKVESANALKSRIGETQRIIKVESNNTSKRTVAANENQTRIVQEQRRGLLKEDVMDTQKSNTKPSKISSEEKSENQKSPEVSVKTSSNDAGSKTNINTVNPPERKSTQLKKLLASMLSLEEDMFPEESEDQMLDEKKNEKLEVGIQVDVSKPEQITQLKAEIKQLKKQLEEKNKTIQQLHQSLSALLPPGQVIMVKSEDDDKYVIFNHHEPPS